ncbi:Fibronectin type III domain protein [Clostridium carboxidivorans P7]|uniref:Fibronectin type III domain protein n=1 Tax=Clostridium carboxidivorans P7 TaxID=536227 RepID=C6PMK1_9CLOT|nr:Ig-like domain repeat protein [Clostridium carboxidivorans]EET89493.1 Fibronectin type III domain protein [Clostridium carboxidivorans P7]
MEKCLKNVVRIITILFILTTLNWKPGVIISKVYAAASQGPTDISLINASIEDKASINDIIGALSATDTDSTTFTYSFVAGNGTNYADNEKFTISGTTLRIKEVPDYSVKKSYSICIRVTDGHGLTYDKAFTISVVRRTANFDKYANSSDYKDIQVNMGVSGDMLSNITNESLVLNPVSQYTVSEDKQIITIKKEYLLGLSNGVASLTFNFSGSIQKTLDIIIDDTTPAAVTSSPNPSIYGQSITFTATVPGGATGIVTFKDGTVTLGTGTISGGTATFSTSALTGGAHTITAVYGGDANYSGSISSAFTQVVNTAASTTTLGSSANPSFYGQSVTFTATVPGGATGTVTFKDGSTTLGTGTLSSGTATFSISALAVGSHSITAVYGGDANYNGSTSSALTQVVNNTVKPAKTLTSDTIYNDVDHYIDIIFGADSDFEGKITGVSFNGNALEASQYGVSSGKVTLKPSAATTDSSKQSYLRTPAAGNVVITATGYDDSIVLQTINAGEVASLVVSRQPAAGITSGDEFATQPIVTLKDQYDNTCSTGVSSTVNVVASAKSGTGTWTIGGTATKAALAGTATFTDLTCSLTAAGNGAIHFASGTPAVDSNTFTIPAATVPGSPTGVSATAGDGQATVSFTGPASDGGSGITVYTVTSNPGNITGTGSASPITVSGLSNGTAYTFTVTATNGVGAGAASSASSSVTPTAPAPLQTAAPVITGTPTAGDTSISGTAEAGSSVILSVGGVAKPAVTAVGGIWTVSGLTLTAGQSISVTAQASGKTISSAATATVAPPTYTLTYTAGPYGTISGISPQNVARGKEGSTITAVPNPGCHFVNWSDSVSTAARIDRKVQNDITVTAYFAIDPPPYIPPTPQPTTETRQVPVVVGNGNQQSTAVQTTITRTTDTQGVKTDTVKFDENTAAEAVKKASEAKSTKAAIDISNTSGKSADKTEFQLPAVSMGELAKQNMSLSLKTEKAALEIPAVTIKKLGEQDAGVKISEEKDGSKIENNKALVLKLASGAQIVAAPLNIEANITGRVKITIPIDSSKIPTSKEELDKFLSSLAVMVHHSDGEDVVDKGTIIYDEKGNVVGISIYVNKFSSFTLIEIPKDYFNGKTTVMPDKVDENKEWHLKFTKAADPSTVTSDNIYVTDLKGNKVDVKVSCDSDNIIKVSPVNPYKSGETYYIYITKKVTSKYKEPLTEALRYEFTVK